MSKHCQITGKVKNNAYNVSHSHVRTKKIQNINLHKKKSLVSNNTKMDKNENIY